MEKQQQFPSSYLRHFVTCTFLLVTLVPPGYGAPDQGSAPFEVSNPKNVKWSPRQAGEIYLAACDQLARTIRPEKPPRIHPHFRLVLGTESDEIVRKDATFEIHLKSWNPDTFAEGVVLIATREVVPEEDLLTIAHHAAMSAQATVSVSELRHHQ